MPSKNEVEKRYGKLNGEKNHQKRGKEFEYFLKFLFDTENIFCELDMTPRGEQYDAYVEFENLIYLIEAKWHSLPISASEIYAFRGKVEGKLVGTIGMFFSMSNYTRPAVNAVTLGKRSCIILFGKDDLEQIVYGRIKLADTIKRKLRAARTKGVIYDTQEKDGLARGKEVARLEYDPSTGTISTRPVNGLKLIVVCEGNTDLEVLTVLTGSVVGEDINHVGIVAAKSKIGLIPAADAVRKMYPRVRLMIVADTDGDLESTSAAIAGWLSKENAVLCLPEPGVEEWFGLPSLRSRRQGTGIGYLADYFESANTLDKPKLSSLRKRSASFRVLYDEFERVKND
ncbi:hypothetical protein [Rhizobium leguminosarum]|uniref:hypothetical protein n=1 Tax=Rhizobium leguminosarum TaxID=384 RepID=UPI003F992428